MDLKKANEARSSLREKNVYSASSFYRFSPKDVESKKKGDNYKTKNSKDGAVVTVGNVNGLIKLIETIKAGGYKELNNVILSSVFNRREDLSFHGGPKGKKYMKMQAEKISEKYSKKGIELTEYEIEYLATEFQFRATMSKDAISRFEKDLKRFQAKGIRQIAFLGLYDFDDDEYDEDEVSSPEYIGSYVKLKYVQYMPITKVKVGENTFIEEHTLTASFEQPNKGKSKGDVYTDAKVGWVLKTESMETLKANVKEHESKDDGSKFYTSRTAIGAKKLYIADNLDDKEKEPLEKANSPFNTVLIRPIKGQYGVFNGTFVVKNGGERFLDNTFNYKKPITLNLALAVERKGQPFGLTAISNAKKEDVGIIFGKYDLNKDSDNNAKYLETLEGEALERAKDRQSMQIKKAEVLVFKDEYISTYNLSDSNTSEKDEKDKSSKSKVSENHTEEGQSQVDAEITIESETNMFDD